MAFVNAILSSVARDLYSILLCYLRSHLPWHEICVGNWYSAGLLDRDVRLHWWRETEYGVDGVGAAHLAMLDSDHIRLIRGREMRT